MGEGHAYRMTRPSEELPILTADETPGVAPAAANRTSKKLGQLLRKRLRQFSRAALVLAIGFALATTALTIWWLNSLNGLPDIGDPFDVAAFRAFSIPEDENAFTLFRRANEKLSPCPVSPHEERSAAAVAWSEADPKLRAGSRRIGRHSSSFSKEPNDPTGSPADPASPTRDAIPRSWARTT